MATGPAADPRDARCRCARGVRGAGAHEPANAPRGPPWGPRLRERYGGSGRAQVPRTACPRWRRPTSRSASSRSRSRPSSISWCGDAPPSPAKRRRRRPPRGRPARAHCRHRVSAPLHAASPRRLASGTAFRPRGTGRGGRPPVVKPVALPGRPSMGLLPLPGGRIIRGHGHRLSPSPKGGVRHARRQLAPAPSRSREPPGNSRPRSVGPVEALAHIDT